MKYEVNNVRVCRDFWLHVNRMGPGTLDKYKLLIRTGQRKSKSRKPERAKPGCEQADTWFLTLYLSLADFNPTEEEGADKQPGAYEIVPVGNDNHPLWSRAVAIGDNKKGVPKKYLPPGRLEDLFSMHQCELGLEAVSRTTLRRCWFDRWKKYLAFRDGGHDKRCKICAELDEWRSTATTAEERQEAQIAKDTHVSEVKQDRDIMVRSGKLAEQAAKQPTVDGFNQVVRVDLDGMDQAKFKCPRNLSSNADFEKLWRPTLHMTGAIIHGHLEAFFIMNSDQPKDANMECTVLSRCLDLIQDKFNDSQYRMPRHLEVHTDSTTREAVNQTFATYLAYLKDSGKFDSTSLERFQKEHTKNEVDQRFSTVATTLSRAPVLEDPWEFKDWILKHVKPVRGRELHVEVLSSTFEFQNWFHDCGVQLSGLASISGETDTTHSWKFVSRELVTECFGQDIVEVHHEEWEHKEKKPQDTIMLLKQFIHSTSLCQPPLLMFPQGTCDQLSPAKLKVVDF